VIFCKSYVFADSQGTRLFFQVTVENVLTHAHTVSCEKRIYNINTS